MEHSVSLTEALCGFKLVVKHLDGRELVIKNKPTDVIFPGEGCYSFFVKRGGRVFK